MARHRSRRRFRFSSVRRRYSRHERGIGRALEGGSFAVTFLSQLTQKDIQNNSSSFSSYTTTDKIRFLTNTVVGRITGINVFSDMPQVSQTINPAGMINKYTGLGIAFGLIYPHIPKAPAKGVIGRLGKGALLGGIFGGLFDAPLRQGGGTLHQRTGPNMSFDGFD